MLFWFLLPALFFLLFLCMFLIWCWDILGSNFVKSLISFQPHTHAQAHRILWCLMKNDSSAWFLLSVTPHTPFPTSPERIRIRWLWQVAPSFIPSPCFPAPPLPFLLVQIGRQHQLSRLIWLFFFLLSLSNLYLPVWFFQSLISCPLSSNSSTFPALLWHIFISTGFFFPFHVSTMFSISSQWNPPLVISHSRLPTLSHTNNDNNNDNFISFFFFFFFFCTLFGYLLSKSSHVSHHPLNGLSPTFTSSRSHSCSPSPLSISLGGPAFLPGFSRPQCENWRWRGRRWRRDNHWSRPQSVFLVTNCRASLSSC